MEVFSCRKWTESLNSRLVIQDCCISFHMIKAAMATKESSQPSWWTFLPSPCPPLPHHDPSPATHSECGYGRPQLLSSQKLTLVIVDIQSTQFAPTSCFHTKKTHKSSDHLFSSHFSLGKWPQTPLLSGRNQMTATDFWPPSHHSFTFVEVSFRNHLVLRDPLMNTNWWVKHKNLHFRP